MVIPYAAVGLLGLSALVGAAPPPYNTKTTRAGPGQTPFSFPLANGFPNIKVPSAELTQIEQQAHGTLPNGGLPTKLSKADATTLQIVAFNELFEVAFFSSLLNNITSNQQGFAAATPDVTVETVVTNLKAIRAQEELHAIGANAILASAGYPTIKPCKYVFPSSTLTQAIRFASTFTDIVLGTLPLVQAQFATNGDGELIPLVGSIEGQEAEQDGWFRDLLGLVPSQLPFLTATGGQFAWSVLNQLVIVKGSCPNFNAIDVPVFAPLTLTTSPIPAQDQTLHFTFQNLLGLNTDNLSLTYLNQQNLPITVNLKNVQRNSKKISFQANFPYTENLMNGLTLAVVTKGHGPFSDANAVAAATAFGPAIIEIM